MPYDYRCKEEWRKVISSEEFDELTKELRLESDPSEGDDGLHQRRLHNLDLIKNGYFEIDDTLVNADWSGGTESNPITKIRKENPEDFTKWKVGKTVVYESSEGREIAMLRPGKEAHRKYSAPSYIEENRRKIRVRKNEFDCLPVILEGKKVIARRVEYQEYDAAIRALKPKQALLDVLEESGLEYDREKRTIKLIQEFLIEKEYKFSKPKVNKFTPWTLEHLAIGLEEIKLKKNGDLALQIIGSLLVRMAFMEDHKQDSQNELYKVCLPEKSMEVLNRILPDGVTINKGMESTSIDSILLLMDLLALNEEVKVDWKGLLNLEEKGSPTAKGRVNTLLTFATFVSNAINQVNIQSKTVFQYQRSQNDPRDLQFYRNSFVFLGDSERSQFIDALRSMIGE